ncbi:MAG: isoprenylcysteine carboxylmethyltransferase family protein [Bacteroidetes bacterium]|nr:isoprenylcysteine carboxylmethyltransferase family protein [Bacteroidota bacterium]
MNLFYLTFFIWILSEVILNRFVRSGKSDKRSADKNTELYLWITIITSVNASVYISQKYSFPIFLQEQFEYAGLALIVAGIIIRFIAIRQLGKFFTVDVTIRSDHELMQDGLYKYLRHPSYSASMLSFLGLGMALNNWLSLGIVFFSVLFAYIHRMNTEERVLTEQFGQKYSDYIQRTKRIIPFVY